MITSNWSAVALTSLLLTLPRNSSKVSIKAFPPAEFNAGIVTATDIVREPIIETVVGYEYAILDSDTRYKLGCLYVDEFGV
jgi:hypothetical protein